LTSTKDIENKITLLHYLVETIESKFPELLTFSEDLTHVDKAARVSVETIQKTLRQMDASIRNLETDLNNTKQPQGDDDRFSEVMGVSFNRFITSLLLHEISGIMGINCTN
jgi:diaphanous 2